MAGNAYLFFGNDEFSATTAAKRKAEELTAGDAFALETLDGEAGTIDRAVEVLDACIEAFRTVGLFAGGRKVVWLRNATFWANAVTMKNERVKKRVGTLAGDLKAGLADGQFLVVSAPGIDKRSALYKAFAASGAAEGFFVSERDYEARPEALARLREVFRKAGFSIERDAADAFVDRVGYEPRRLINEAEKTMRYKGAERAIDLDDVRAVVSASGETLIWDFTDAVAARKFGPAVRLFRRLLFQKQTPIGLIVQLENLFRDLLRFREYQEAGWLRMNGRRVEWSNEPAMDDYFACLDADPRKMHWFRASKLASQAAGYSVRGLAARKRLATDTHERMVSPGGAISHELLFETLLIKLCAPRSRRKRAREGGRR